MPYYSVRHRAARPPGAVTQRPLSSRRRWPETPTGMEVRVPGKISGFFRSLTQFNRSFWSANISELFERIAFYSMTTMLVLYLTTVRGIPEGAATRLSGNFGLVVYGLPVLSGFLADWLGYRRAFMLAYSLLAVGYLLIGQLTTYWGIAGALLLVAMGASIVKPTVTGTVQKTSVTAMAAVGFSIYYMLVNIGSFIAHNLAGQVSDRIGVIPVFYFSTGAAIIALLLILGLFREPAPKPPAEGQEAKPQEQKSLSSFLGDFLKVIVNVRLMLLFLFVAGFWSMFFQFYNALPLYVTQDLGETRSLYGFIVSLDAAAIVCFQVIVGYLVRNMKTPVAVLMGVVIAAVGVMVIGAVASPWSIGLGILIFAIGEMAYAAHFYKYLGDMAPPDQVGMYMGFAFLPIALGSFFSGLMASPVANFARETLGNPQLMWVLFGLVGIVSAIGIWLLTVFAKPQPSTEEVTTTG
jgi:POT family proton-dependent oligopeptide transporter